MRRDILLDAGPLVAYLNRRDQYHAWAVAEWERMEPPLLTCEAVLSEACFLVESHGGAPAWVFDLVERGVVEVRFSVMEHVARVRTLLAKYRSVPMSLADACLVRMSELNPKHAVFTADSDFRLYRREGRRVIPTIMPDGVQSCSR